MGHLTIDIIPQPALLALHDTIFVHLAVIIPEDNKHLRIFVLEEYSELDKLRHQKAPYEAIAGCVSGV